MLAPGRFVLTLTGLWLGVLGLLRLGWTEAHVLVPIARWQMRIASWYGASSDVPVAAVASCSGADVMALCAGILLAYPSGLRRRMTGLALGLALIVLVNTIRIGTLWSFAGSPDAFALLHLYIWPLALLLVVTLYVYLWLRSDPASRSDGSRAADHGRARIGSPQSSSARPFLLALAVSLVVFGAAAPWLMTSETIAAAGALVARLAGGLMSGLGLEASASGSLLATSRGSFAVTPECIASPLIALYVAAVWTWAPSLRARVWLSALAAPLFFLLAIARLLVLALPPFLVGEGDTSLFAVHGFFQFVLAVVLVTSVALWREESRRRGWSLAAAAVGAGLAVALIAGSLYSFVLLWAARGLRGLAPHVLTELAQPGDAQGALFVLPAFQLALVTALLLSMRAPSRRLVTAGLAIVFSTQLGLLVGLGELRAHTGIEPHAHALLLRGLAVIVPIGIVFALDASNRRRPRDAGAPA